MRGILSLCVILGWGLLPPALLAQGKAAPRVALVLDRDSPTLQPMLDAFQREILTFFRPGELELLPPRSGDGTTSGVRAALNGAFRDPSVSVVIALGPIGSHLLARSGKPAKPSIAAIIIDASWQDLPQHDGVSGVPDLTYVDQSYPVGSTLVDFHRLIPFHRLAVLLDRDLLRGIPQLEPGVMALVRSAGGEASIVPVVDRAQDVLAALPPETDAVYVTQFPGMSEEEFTRLLAELNQRRLPTLSFSADPEVRLGVLASYEPPENWRRRSRRVAVDLQRILAGEDAGTLPVRLVSAPRLTLNLATARLIGFAPGWSVLTDAELVSVDSAGPPDTLALPEAMHGALQANLDVAAADLEVASGRQDVRLARSELLPDVESRLTQTFTRSETAAASLGQQPQRTLDGEVSLSMPLYSERAWAAHGSQRSLQEGRVAERDQLRLDVVLQAAEAYLNVLRARTQADVQRSNLYRSRSNLEVARLRESVGSSSRADVYRWQGEVANSRRNLISAESQVRVAALELKRVLNRPLNQPVAQRPVSLGSPVLLAEDSTVLAWFDDPPRFATMTEFLVREALSISPELIQAEAAIKAQQRQRTAAGRAFWLPTLSLQGGLSNEFSRGGAGATQQALPQPFTGLFERGPDLTWQVKLQASIPLFTGFGRTATRAQAGIDLDRLEVQRDGIRQSLDQRVRAALETASSSYAAIALTRDAADAAGRNYDLVSDAYASGSASITTLLDAQSSALTSSQSAANAVHDFLLDLMRVERAMGVFGTLKPPEERQAFLQRLQAFMREQRP